MPDINVEISIFLNSIGTGMVVCLVYKCLSLFQLLHKKQKWLINAEDIIYWFWFSVYICSRIFDITLGAIRWYIIAGIVVGVWSTHYIWYSAKKVVINSAKNLAKE